jgi:hypothetical protein
MVVIKDHGGGAVMNDGPDDLAWMNARAIDGASKEIFRCDQAMTLIEVETSEDFIVERS